MIVIKDKPTSRYPPHIKELGWAVFELRHKTTAFRFVKNAICLPRGPEFLKAQSGASSAYATFLRVGADINPPPLSIRLSQT